MEPLDPFLPAAASRADGRRPGAWPADSCVVTSDQVAPLPSQLDALLLDAGRVAP